MSPSSLPVHHDSAVLLVTLVSLPLLNAASFSAVPQTPVLFDRPVSGVFSRAHLHETVKAHRASSSKAAQDGEAAAQPKRKPLTVVTYSDATALVDWAQSCHM